MKYEITMSYEKETPGTFRYQEESEDSEPIIGTLYIKKHAFEGEERPENIKVTIEDKK